MSIYRGRPPLILFRSNDICFLGILRACRAAGIPVVVFKFTWPGANEWFSERSTVERSEIEIPNPFEYPREAASATLQALRKLAERHGQRLMALPSSDTNLMFLLDNYADFSRYIRLMGRSDFSASPQDLVDKWACYRTLEATLPHMVPASRRCASAADIPAIVDSLHYPVVYKPATKDYGQTFYQAHGGKKAIECASADALRAGLQAEMAQGFVLLVQEKIEFDSARDEIPFYLYADADGGIRMAANGIKEEIFPPPFGTAIVLRFAWLPELKAAAEQVVAATGYRGILMIEFIRDQRDGNWKVIELNTRHWLFNGFYQRLGFNYTDMLYRDLTADPMPTCVTAEPALLARAYAHLDLFAIATEMAGRTGPPSLSDFCARLDAIGGSRTAAFVDPADPGPGERRLEALAGHFGWDPAGTRAEVMRRLVQDV